MEKSLNVSIRTETGKNSCNRIREKGLIPAVLYSHGISEVLEVNEKDFFNLFKGKISESIIVDLVFKDRKEMAFVKKYQTDPVTDSIMHIDFFKVTKGEKITTQVSIELQGSPEGVRLGGILDFMERTVEIECLPGQLPEKIVVDVSSLNIGSTIHASDLVLGEGVKLLTSPTNVIVSVHQLKVVVEKTETTGETAAEGQAEASEESSKKE